MKTQIIKLDSHDNVISVRDKMSWAKTERILLVFPRHHRILARTLDLRLLQRHATELGAQVAIVTRLDDLRLSAEEMNIPAFTRIASAQRMTWEREKAPPEQIHRFLRPDLRQMRREVFPPEAPWRSLYGVRFGFFTLGVLAILVIPLLFIPSATIHLTAATRQQSLMISLSASSKVITVNLGGSLPARMSSMIVESSKTTKATGLVSIPKNRAQGLAHFRNLSTTLTGIPAGTVISTQTSPPIRFATTMDAVVAAGIDETVDVPIQAIEAGSMGNQEAGKIFAIEGELGTSLSVNNIIPTGGGSDRTAAIQTAADRSQLLAALQTDLLEQCKTLIPEKLSQGDIFFQDTLVVSQILSKSYFPAEGQSGDTLSLTMRLQCQAQYASLADVTALGKMSLDADLRGSFIPTSDGITLTIASKPITDSEGVTRWIMQAGRELQARMDPRAVVQLSLGRKPADAISKLKESISIGRSPEIKINPAWWPWLPMIPFRIVVSSGI
jgi:hypothetical protein